MSQPPLRSSPLSSPLSLSLSLISSHPGPEVLILPLRLGSAIIRDMTDTSRFSRKAKGRERQKGKQCTCSLFTCGAEMVSHATRAVSLAFLFFFHLPLSLSPSLSFSFPVLSMCMLCAVEFCRRTEHGERYESIARVSCMTGEDAAKVSGCFLARLLTLGAD
jgi:hypothetical protein